MPDLVEQSIRDSFRATASSTLQKRAASLWRLFKLLLVAGTESPLSFTEDQLYSCLCELRVNGARVLHLDNLEALCFLDGAAKFINLKLHTVISGRCKGAGDMYLTKNPLQQKCPLTAGQVKALEQLMATLGTQDRCIFGQVLFCVHACCRWRDSQRIRVNALQTHDSK